MAIDFPNSPIEGQQYAVGSTTWTYTDGKWVLSPGGGRAIVSDAAPLNPIIGDTWFESDTGSFYVYYDGFWIEVGYPALAPGSVRGPKNAIINGAFDVWQRGAGPFSITTWTYSADRWTGLTGGGTTNSITRQAFPLGNAIPGYEPTFFMRNVVVAGGSANHHAMTRQHIESVRTFAGQTVTVSFWAKADAAGKSVSLELEQSFGNGGSPSGTVGTFIAKVALSTVWTRYSATFTVPSIAGKTLGTADDGSFQLNFWLDADTTFNSRTGSLGSQSITFDLWGVQVEAGNGATVFEHRPVVDELRRCHRYYVRIPDWKSTLNWLSGTVAVSDLHQFPVPMRATPTMYYTKGTHRDGNGDFYPASGAVARLPITTNQTNAYGFAVQYGGNYTFVDTFYVEAEAEL